MRWAPLRSGLRAETGAVWNIATRAQACIHELSNLAGALISRRMLNRQPLVTKDGQEMTKGVRFRPRHDSRIGGTDPQLAVRITNAMTKQERLHDCHEPRLI